MTVLIQEGFEGLGTTTGVVDTANVQARLHDRYGGVFGQGNGVHLQPGLVQGFALSWGTIGTSNANEFNIVIPDQKTNTMVVGHRFKTSLGDTATDTILSIRSVSFANDHLNLRVVNNVDIQVRRVTTVLATAVAALTADTWHYIEFKFFVDNATGSFDLRVDGSSVASGSSVDTQDGSGSALVNQIRFEGFNSFSEADFSGIDDIYILNNLGPNNNDFRGDSVVIQSLPDSDVLTGWTPDTGGVNFSRVNEDPEDAANHVQATTVGTKDRYGFANISKNGIFAVQQEVQVLTADDGLSAMRLNAFSNGNANNGAPQIVSDQVNVARLIEIFETDPDTGSPWLKAGFDSAQFEIEVQT